MLGLSFLSLPSQTIVILSAAEGSLYLQLQFAFAPP
jgi:hypothetical protein